MSVKTFQYGVLSLIYFGKALNTLFTENFTNDIYFDERQISLLQINFGTIETL